MTLCPIAIAVTCAKCPVVGICPAKSVLGDYKEPPTPDPKSKSNRAAKKSGKKK